MRLDRRWPAWHPEQELKAEHLLGLEDYLVARSAFVDDNAHGVDLFDWQTGLRFEPQSDALRVVARRLQGVTPAGEPVCLTSGEELETTVPLHIDGRPSSLVPTMIRQLSIDVWIDVNRPAAEQPDSEGGAANGQEPVLPAKLSLRAERVTLDETHPLQPARDTHSLYLGRYRCVADESGTSCVHDLMHEPLVRRFGGLQPFDERWQRWVAPLRLRLEGLARQAEVAGVGHSVSGVLLATELLRTAFEWTAVPLPTLYRRLRFISWLSARDGTGEVLDIASALPMFPEDTSGPALPTMLAEVLPDTVATAPAALSSLPDALNGLLQALGRYDVDYHAPAAAFERWVTELLRVRASGRGATTARAMSEGIAADIARLDVIPGQSPWISAVLLVTAAVMEAATGEGFPRSILEPYRRIGSSVAAEAARLLSEMYRQEADKRRAGPLAFYWLARAAADVPELVNAGTADLSFYIARLQGRSGDDAAGRRSRASHRPAAASGRADRALNYLVSIQQPGTTTPTAIDSMSWIHRSGPADRSSRRTAPMRPPALKVALIGPSGSGKTTLLRQLCSTATSSTSRLPVRLELAMSAAEDGVAVADGTVDLAAGALPLKFVDIAGSLLERVDPTARDLQTSESQAPYSLVRDCQLVILTLDAASIAGTSLPQTIDQLSRITSWVTQRTGAVVALAYTKADEYGVITPQEVRFVSEQKGADLRSALAGSAASWDKLAGPVAESDARSRVGVALLSKPGMTLAPGESGPTRAWLLSKTRSLWSAIGAREPSTFLNAYFVSAEGRDPRFGRPEDRGFLHLLADFFGQLEGRV